MPRVSVAIGIFDGVHAGHQRILDEAARHGRVTVLTFHPHPTSVFAPDRTPSVLVSIEDRISLLESYGVAEVHVMEFTKEFSAMSADDFIQKVLVDQLHATHVCVGENFTFGYKASGNVAYLKSHAIGFEVSALKLDENRGSAISSTRIRNLIIDGDIERANELLTRNYYLWGAVVHGEKRGREIGYPTANLGLPDHATIPADGVYAGWLTVGEHRWAAAISIGTNPTFPGVRGRQVEAHALDQVGLDLYDQDGKIEFVARLRETLKFEGLDLLLAQMKIDCDQARELLK